MHSAKQVSCFTTTTAHRENDKTGVIDLLKTLTFRGLLIFAVAIVLTTAFMTWLVISYEPPAFMGYVFGAFSGALWISLYVLIRDYYEGH